MQKTKKKKLMVVGISPSGQRGFQIRRLEDLEKPQEKPAAVRKQTA